MKRVARVAPWLFATGSFAFVILAAVGQFENDTWRIALGVAAVVACWIGRARHEIPWPFVLATVVVAGWAISLDTMPDVAPVGSPSHSEIATLLVGFVLIAVLATALRERRGRIDQRDVNDFLTVAISSSLASWIIVASPLLDKGVPLNHALGAAALLPLSAILFWFVIDLMCSDLADNRAMQLISAAAAFMLAGAIATSLNTAAGIESDRALEVALFAGSAMLLFAGVAHRDVLATLARNEADNPDGYSPVRLVMNGASLVIGGALIASIAPVDTVDILIRVGAVVIGIASVMTRLVFAISSHEAAQKRLELRLDLDDLTNLPSRRRFVAVVDEALEATWRSEFQPTVIQLNIDRFKNINDSLGHYEANEVLVAVSRRLTRAATPFGGVVGRVGGDDFAVLDVTTRTHDDALERLERLRDALTEVLHIGDAQLFVTASFGVTLAPRNRTSTAEDLLRRADIATHRAKAAGRSGVEVFDDSMQAELTHRMDVEHALHGAVERRELRLYHQPIVDLDTGFVSGFESLIRWQRGDKTVMPGDFVSIAEETGTIRQIGQWALNEALQELRGWLDDGVVGPETTISVNVSPRQVADASFADVVRDALDATGVPARHLWLEMTESMMLEEPELAETTLRRICDMGVRIALDDFGTGFSSLSLLQQFPIHRIKIDRAFVNGIAEPGNDRSLVRTIVAMAHSMGLDLVAEGVETVEQLRVLAEIDCTRAQGYLISHPVPADAMRSTMVALDELTSLSLFTKGADALTTATDAPAATSTPVAAAVGGGPTAQTEASVRATPIEPVPSTSRFPVGVSSRPLGHPVL